MRTLLLLAPALALGACASSSTIQPNMSRMHAQQGGSAIIRVMGDEPVAGQLKNAVRDLLRRSKAYDVIDQDEAQTQIEIFVTRVARVGRTKRIAMGPLAGRARLSVQVVVRQYGKTVDSFLVDGRSSGGSPLAGTTSQAVEMTALRIVERLTS